MYVNRNWKRGGGANYLVYSPSLFHELQAFRSLKEKIRRGGAAYISYSTNRISFFYSFILGGPRNRSMNVRFMHFGCLHVAMIFFQF